MCAVSGLPVFDLSNNGLRRDVLINLRELPFAPSVALQHIPRQSVGDIISQNSDGDDDEDDQGDHSDIDQRIKSKPSFSAAGCISSYFQSL